MKLLQVLVNEKRQTINRGTVGYLYDRKSNCKTNCKNFYIINPSCFSGHEHLNVLKDVNLQLAQRLPRHEERIEKVQKFLNSLKQRQEKQKENLERKRQLLKKVIRVATKQLIQYIFPLGQVDSATER